MRNDLALEEHFIKHSDMPIQYISDNAGNHTAVVIPMSEWELLTRKHEDLKQLELPKQDLLNKKPSDFAGTMPAEVAEAFSKYVANEPAFSIETKQKYGNALTLEESLQSTLQLVDKLFDEDAKSKN